MKKVYQDSKWKDHSKSVSKKRLRQIKSRKKLIHEVNLVVEKAYAKPQLHRQINHHVPSTKKRKIVQAPSILSIVDDTEGILFFLDRVNAHVASGESVFLELSDVTTLTPDALLYILSTFEEFESTYGYMDIEGNLPADSACKEMMLSSGFLKYFETQLPKENHSEHIMHILSDSSVDGKFASEAKQFTIAHIHGKTHRQYKAIYEMMIECMSNTKGHAYIKRKYDKGDRNKWWFIAYYGEAEGKINFAFLDNGAGIVNTLHTTHKEKVLKLYDTLRAMVTDGAPGREYDKLLIMSALQGQFRTRTRQGFRGKGLPKMFEHNNSGTISDLKVISNMGYVDCSKNEAQDLSRQFKGTLLTWSFC